MIENLEARHRGWSITFDVEQGAWQHDARYGPDKRWGSWIEVRGASLALSESGDVQKARWTLHGVIIKVDGTPGKRRRVEDYVPFDAAPVQVQRRITELARELRGG